MTRALVTYPASPLGQRVVRLLLDRGIEVRGCGGAKSTETGVDTKAWPRSAAGFTKLLEDCDYVILYADTENGTVDDRDVARFSNLISAAAETELDRLIFVGTTDVYDPTARAIGTVSETAPLVDPSLASARAKAAIDIEHSISNARSDLTDFVVLRLPMLFGRDLPKAVDLVRDTWRSGVSTWDAARLQGIDVDDAADMITRAVFADDAPGYALNIAGPIAISSDSVAAEIKRLAQILTDDTDTSIRVRPDYASVEQIFDTRSCRKILGARPKKRIWVNLAQILQKIIHDERAAGALPPVRSGLPASLEALQNNTLPFEGKRILLTGASGDVGGLVQDRLARLGAHVLCVHDSDEDAEKARARLPKALGPQLMPIIADLTLVEDMRRVAELAMSQPSLYAVLHVDARIYETCERTHEGLERTFALNLLAPIVLTELLSETLLATKDSRIINVVNGHFRDCPLDLDDLQGDIAFSPLPSFGRAQAGRLMLNAAFDGVIKGSSSKVVTVVPGQLRTETWHLIDVPRNDPNIGAQEQQRLQGMRDRAEAQMVAPDDAAEQIVDVLLSANPETASERYLAREQSRPLPNHVQDVETVAALWTECRELAGLEPLAAVDAWMEPDAEWDMDAY